VNCETESRRGSTALLFTLFFITLFALHLPVLRLPYFWDEGGYYVPAARDLWLTGSLIPHSTPSNAHPPLVMAYLALAWKIFGYAPVVTRTAMLAVAAFSLLGLFRLAQRVANTPVAIATIICTAIYPVFFSQSSLAHVDLAAAGLSWWGILAYIEDRKLAMVTWLSLAALAKETAILAAGALSAWELLRMFLKPELSDAGESRRPRFLLLAPLLPLAAWYAYHYHRTGFVFGNPEFFRYNVQATVQPLRILIAIFLRSWQVLAYLNLYFLTLAALFAMFRSPVADRGIERKRIALPVQIAFLSIITAYVLAMAVIGGAVLARYMLTAVPLVIMVSVSTIRRRVRLWPVVIAIVTFTFVVGIFVNPPYGFSVEDNLAYRDYIRLHQAAETYLETRAPMARVLTAWPASSELTTPELGFNTRPMKVVRIENFTAEQLFAAAELRPQFDYALVFSTKYQPPNAWFAHWNAWQRWKTEFFDYHRDLPPAAAAQILGGEIIYEQHRKGQWIAVIEMTGIEEAQARAPTRP